MISPQRIVRAASMLAGGNAVAHLAPIIAMPLLARMFAPEDFAPVSIVAAWVVVISSGASGRLEIAIAGERTTRRSISVASFAIALAAGVSLVLLPVLWILYASGVGVPGIATRPELAACIPIAVFGTALFNIGTALSNNRREYGLSASAAASRGIVMVAVQVALGMITRDAWVLVVGFAVSSLFGSVRLISPFRRELVRRWRRPRRRCLAIARVHSGYLSLGTAGAVLNMLAVNAATVLAAQHYSDGFVGQFGSVQRLLGAPVALIGLATSQVLMVEVSRAGKGESTLALFRSVERKLVVLSLLSFGVLALFARPAVTWFLGDEWIESAGIVAVLAPLFALRLVGSALSSVALSLGAHSMFFLWQCGLLLITLACWLPGWGFYESLTSWSMLAAIHYALLPYLIGRRLADREVQREDSGS